MSNFRFYYDDQWKDFDVSVLGSEHPNFPATNADIDDYRSSVYRSRYGEGSTWGRFYISSTTNKLDFNEGAGELTATIGVAVYSADSLAAEIETQMEAAGTHNYTVEYLESGSDICKFKITDDTGAVALLCNTGTNVANGIWDTIGFAAADRLSVASHTADDIRIHTAEYITKDFGSALSFHACVIVGHNKTATGTYKIQFSTDNFASIAQTYTMTASSERSDILYYIFSSAQTYRYARIYIEDSENGDYYSEVGRALLFLSPFEPAVNFDPFNYSETEIDPSMIVAGPDGNESGAQYEKYNQWRYNFYVQAEKSDFKTVISDRGRLGSLVIVEDPSSVIPRFVAIDSHNWSPISKDEDVWNLDISFRELR